MTKKQKDFILNKLIPFILREEGRGFQMADWLRTGLGGEFQNCDLDQIIPSPKCGTVACIGGSVNYLTKTDGEFHATRILGLTEREGSALFYDWDTHLFSQRELNKSFNYGWPPSFAARFADAKTPLAKAEVACDLLREVVRTEGKCLHIGRPESV